MSAYCTHGVFPKQSWKKFKPEENGARHVLFACLFACCHVYFMCRIDLACALLAFLCAAMCFQRLTCSVVVVLHSTGTSSCMACWCPSQLPCTPSVKMRFIQYSLLLPLRRRRQDGFQVLLCDGQLPTHIQGECDYKRLYVGVSCLSNMALAKRESCKLPVMAVLSLAHFGSYVAVHGACAIATACLFFVFWHFGCGQAKQHAI